MDRNIQRVYWPKADDYRSRGDWRMNKLPGMDEPEEQDAPELVRAGLGDSPSRAARRRRRRNRPGRGDEIAAASGRSLGVAAVERGWITSGQLAGCDSLRREISALGLAMSLGQALLESGHLEFDQIRELSAEGVVAAPIDFYRLPVDEHARLALRIGAEGLVESAALNQSLAIQARLEELGIDKQLGEILLQMGCIPPAVEEDYLPHRVRFVARSVLDRVRRRRARRQAGSRAPRRPVRRETRRLREIRIESGARSRPVEPLPLYDAADLEILPIDARPADDVVAPAPAPAPAPARPIVARRPRWPWGLAAAALLCLGLALGLAGGDDPGAGRSIRPVADARPVAPAPAPSVRRAPVVRPVADPAPAGPSDVLAALAGPPEAVDRRRRLLDLADRVPFDEADEARHASREIDGILAVASASAADGGRVVLVRVHAWLPAGSTLQLALARDRRPVDRLRLVVGADGWAAGWFGPYAASAPEDVFAPQELPWLPGDRYRVRLEGQPVEGGYTVGPMRLLAEADLEYPSGDERADRRVLARLADALGDWLERGAHARRQLRAGDRAAADRLVDAAGPLAESMARAARNLPTHQALLVEARQQIDRTIALVEASRRGGGPVQSALVRWEKGDGNLERLCLEDDLLAPAVASVGSR